MIKNIYLNVDTVGCHIFIYLLVNLIKSKSVECKQFILILGLVRTVVLFTFFFPYYKKSIFFFNDIIEGYSQRMKTNQKKN